MTFLEKFSIQELSWFEHKVTSLWLESRLKDGMELWWIFGFQFVRNSLFFMFFMICMHSSNVLNLQKFVMEVLWSFGVWFWSIFDELECFKFHKALELDSRKTPRLGKMILMTIGQKCIDPLWWINQLI